MPTSSCANGAKFTPPPVASSSFRAVSPPNSRRTSTSPSRSVDTPKVPRVRSASTRKIRSLSYQSLRCEQDHAASNQAVPPALDADSLASAQSREAVVEPDNQATQQLWQSLRELRGELELQGHALREALGMFVQQSPCPHLDKIRTITTTARIDALARRIGEEIGEVREELRSSIENLRSEASETAVRLDKQLSLERERHTRDVSDLCSAIEQIHVVQSENKSGLAPGHQCISFTKAGSSLSKTLKKSSIKNAHISWDDEVHDVRERLEDVQASTCISAVSSTSPIKDNDFPTTPMAREHARRLEKIAGVARDLHDLQKAPSSTSPTTSHTGTFDWDALVEMLVKSDIPSCPTRGNRPSSDFQRGCEVFAQEIASVTSAAFSIESQHGENARQAVRNLIASLTVGFISPESPAYFRRRGRILLRGPCAMALQVAAMVLPLKEREQLASYLAELLEKPEHFPARIWASSSEVREHCLASITELRRSKHVDTTRSNLNGRHDNLILDAGVLGGVSSAISLANADVLAELGHHDFNWGDGLPSARDKEGDKHCASTLLYSLLCLLPMEEKSSDSVMIERHSHKAISSLHC